MTGLKRGDILLIAFFLLLAVGVLIFNLQVSSELPTRVEIRDGNSIYSVYELDEDEVIHIDDEHRHNTIRIQDGVAYMESANCRDQLCLGMGEISRVGQSIVCLPNRIAVRILGEEEGVIDALSQ